MRALAAIFALALVLRLVWVTAVPSEPIPTHDSEIYRTMAIALANGDGFMMERYTLPDGQAALTPGLAHPPGYPAFLGGLYAIFGSSLAVGRLANAVLGALTVFPVFWAARRLASQRVALIAAAIVAVTPSLIVWSSTLYSETMFTLVFTTALAALLWSRKDASIDLRLVALAGALLALSLQIRTPTVVAIPAGLLWLALPGLRTPRLPAAALLVVALPGLAAAAWGLRNVVEYDSFTPFTSCGGINFRKGHAPNSTGRDVPAQDLPSRTPPSADVRRADLELAASSLGWDLGFDYLVSHPGRELSLSLRKVVWLWRPAAGGVHEADADGKISIPLGRWPAKIAVVTFHCGFGVLVIAGLWLARRDRDAILPPVALVVFWTALHVVFFGQARYALPLLPILSLPAAIALVYLIDRIGLSTRVPAGVGSA
ncbi:MAG TPA: glycosyltransferase family 39 protein [Dehalococcoidia bacterium]|nr:glycosyltransferase family 39 protein [Dehalococcoidia bacterium]